MAERLGSIGGHVAVSVCGREATTEDRHVFYRHMFIPDESPVIGHVRPITAPVASQLADSRSDNQIQHWSYAE